MKITDETRAKIETLAKEAAQRHYRKTNPRGSDAAAFSFACRHWRSAEFVQAACDCLAFEVAIDEAAAAPFN